jgi:hypothetical protein
MCLVVYDAAGRVGGIPSPQGFPVLAISAQAGLGSGPVVWQEVGYG